MNKLRTLLTALAIFYSSFLYSQSLTNYSFSAISGTYTNITGTALTLSGGSLDEGWYNNIPIGFTFWYMGQPYTQIHAGTNGFACFGTPLSGALFTNNLATGGGTNRPILAPLWDDNEVDATGSVRYETVGTPGNRVFTLQWDKVQWNWLALGPVISFQLKLYEATGVIEFIYNQESSAVNSGSASIGISAVGTGAGNFLSLSDASSSPTVSSTTETTTINAKPANGQIYQFTPNSVVAPINLTFTAVGSTSMTLNWEDNSTNEATFYIYRSLDGINYTFAGTVASTSTATTGTPYNFVATGLSASTLYYWNVYAVSEFTSSPLAGTQSTTAGTMCGTYTVGPTGAYTSLTAAFADLATNSLSCPVIFELQAAYASTVETFPLNVPFFGGSSTLNVTVRPETGATGLSISSNATSTLLMNGTTWITFDGRPGGTGTSRELTILNVNTSGIAVSYTNNTQNTTLTYLNVTGMNNTTTGGIIVFGNALTTGGGNSNNTITQCDIYPAAATLNNCILSSNTIAGTFNQNNVISFNTIRDYFNAATVSNGIFISGGNDAWTISNNSFYQTAARTYTTGNIHYAINIANTGSGYIITDNFIGGSAPLCGGSDYTMGGTIATRFVGINISATGPNTNVVNFNTIRKFSLTTTSGATSANGVWCGINALGTGSNVTIANNTIGDNTTTNNIKTTISTAGGLTVGIHASASGVLNILNNNIGGIQANSSSGFVSSSVIGINISTTAGTGIRTIQNNLIGSLSIPNSIMNAANVSTTAGNMIGIDVSIGGTYNILNNQIVGLVNQYAGTSASSVTRGIRITSGIANITGNQITTMATLASNTSITSTGVSIAGIQMTSTTTGNHIIENNTIAGIANGNTTANTAVYGISYAGPSTIRGQIRKNNIAYLANQSSSTSALITGLFAGGGLATYSNNFINLGIDPSGSPLTLSQVYQGIRKDNTASNNFFHNTVLIQGSGVGAGAANTQAFARLQTGVDSLVNNILVNNRSNGASTGTHYSIQTNNLTTFTSNYNDLYGNGTGYMVGRDGTTDYATFANWQSTGQDAVSKNVDPQFINTVNNLHITTGTPNQLESGGSLLTILDDIDNDVRPGPTGSVNGGAIMPDIGADEFDGIIVPGGNNDLSVTLLVTPTNTSCYTNQTTVTFRIKNNAIYTIDFSVDNATLNASVTGPNPQTFSPVTINSGTIAPGATLDITVSTTYDMSAIGNYVFTGTVSIINDLNASNNTLNASILGKGAVTATAPADVSICSGSSTTLNATGAASYSNPTTFNSTHSPLTIPDNDIVTGVTSTLTIPAAYSVWNASNVVSVNLSISHTWNSDLDIYLQAPDGSQIELSTDNGGGGDGYTNVTFTPNAPANITTAPISPNITGNWQPEQPFSLLTGSADGNWNLRVFDDMGGDVGTLDNWSITFLGQGGVTYTWTPVTGLSDPNVANPVATPASTTTYIVTVTDNVTGCTSTDDVIVTVNPLPVITKVTTAPTCVPGNDGIIDITVTGNAPFTYNWSTTATTEDLTGVGFGTYTVTVTDNNLCSATDVTTFAVSGFTLSGVITDVTCNGGSNGQIDITPSGGTLPYTYNWSNSSTSEDLTGISAGTYTVTVTDDNGCSVTDNYTVNEPSLITITGVITDVDCYNNTTGGVDITVSGGTPGYSYSWSNTATTEDISLVVAGVYTVTVTDNNLCTNTATFTVNEPAALSIIHSSNNISCFGLTDGSIDITVSGGVTAYNYLWSNSATTEDLTGLSANTYTVTVTDNNSCTISYSVTITEPTALTHTITSSNALCFGTTTGSAQVFPTGGTTPYSYLWSNGGTTASVNLGAGTYTVTITDHNGCTNTNSVTITEPLLLTANITSYTDVTCFNANNGTATAVGGFGTPGYSYAWSNGATTSTVNGLDGGTYTVTITDNNSCTATATVTINEPSAITAPGNITDEVWGNDGAVDITPAGGTAPYTFGWNNGATTEDISGLAGGTYTVTITDDNGCTQSFTYTVVSYVGIDNPTTQIGVINFYPNPSNGQLNMSVAGFTGSTLQLEVLDMNGKVVFIKQIKNAPESFIQEMDLRTLTMGTYFIRVTSENGVHTSRIIIARD